MGRSRGFSEHFIKAHVVKQEINTLGAVGNNEVIFYHPPIIVNKDKLRCFLDLELTISMERTNMDKHDWFWMTIYSILAENCKSQIVKASYWDSEWVLPPITVKMQNSGRLEIWVRKRNYVKGQKVCWRSCLLLEISIQDVYGNDVSDDKDENVRTFILLSTEHYFYVFICVWLSMAESSCK